MKHIRFLIALMVFINPLSVSMADISLSDIRYMDIVNENPALKGLDIPYNLGIVKDAWYAGEKSSDGTEKTIIHILDAHCNYDAQKKISEIIRYLNNNYDCSVVNLEGGSGSYDMMAFNDIYETDVKNEVAEYFLKKGLISGPEYFAINDPDKVELWGVENPDLYLGNLMVYRDFLSHKKETGNTIKEIIRLLNVLKKRVYSPELFEFDKKTSGFKYSREDIKDYVSYIAETARELNIDISTFPNIDKLLQIFVIENNVDFRSASGEREILVKSLEDVFSPKEKKELGIKVLQAKENIISRKDFYSYLLDKAKSVNLDPDSFKNIQAYLMYISEYEETDKLAVAEEITGIEEIIKDRLYTDISQKELDVLSKDMELIEDMFGISLTRARYKYYKENRNRFDVGNYISFLKKHLTPEDFPGNLTERMLDLDARREEIEKFYEYSFRRDNAFLENIRFEKYPEEKDPSKRELTILVTGGFHAENLSSMFREKNISYITVVPYFKKPPGYKSPYLSLISGAVDDIEQVIISFGDSALAVASNLNILGDNVNGVENWKVFNLYIKWVTELKRAGVNYGKGIIVENYGDFVCAIDPDDNVITDEAGIADSGNFIKVDAVLGRVPYRVLGQLERKEWRHLLGTTNSKLLATKLAECMVLGDERHDDTKVMEMVRKHLPDEIKLHLAAFVHDIGKAGFFISMAEAEEVVEKAVEEALGAMADGRAPPVIPTAEDVYTVITKIYGIQINRPGGIVLKKRIRSKFRNGETVLQKLIDEGWMEDMTDEKIVMTKDMRQNDIQRQRFKEGLPGLTGEENRELVSILGDVKWIKDLPLIDFFEQSVHEGFITDEEKDRYIAALELIENPFAPEGREDKRFDVNTDTLGDIYEGHPFWGALLLRRADVMREIIEIIVQHHKTEMRSGQPIIIHVDIDDENFMEWEITRYRAEDLEGDLTPDMVAKMMSVRDMTEAGVNLSTADKIEAKFGRFEAGSGKSPEELYRVGLRIQMAYMRDSLLPRREYFMEVIRGWDVYGQWEDILKDLEDKTTSLKAIGKVKDKDGNDVTEDISVRLQTEGNIVISHGNMDDITLTADKVPQGESEMLIGSMDILKEIIEKETDLPDWVKASASAMFESTVLKGNIELFYISDNENIKGLFFEERPFGGVPRLYLNKGLMDNMIKSAESLQGERSGSLSVGDMRRSGFFINAMGFLHELGEGFVPIPDNSGGLTRHTIMRGAGKDVRKAFDSIDKEKMGQLEEAVNADAYISELESQLRDMYEKGDMSDSRKLSFEKDTASGFLTESERALIGLNFGSGVKGEELLSGVQDHLDPNGNTAFTSLIGLLTDNIRSGSQDIYVMPRAEDISFRSSQQRIGASISRVHQKKYGNNMVVIYYDADDEQSLKDAMARAREHVVSGYPEGKRPMVFVNVIDTAGRDKVKEWLDIEGEDKISGTDATIRERFNIGSDIEPDREETPAVIDEIKVIAIGNAIMNDKRLRYDFGLDPDNEFVMESRSSMFRFLIDNGILDDSVRFISEDGESMELDAGNRDNYETILRNIWNGNIYLRISKINWEEIREWQNSQLEVMRSL